MLSRYLIDHTRFINSRGVSVLNGRTLKSDIRWMNEVRMEDQIEASGKVTREEEETRVQKLE